MYGLTYKDVRRVVEFGRRQQRQVLEQRRASRLRRPKPLVFGKGSLVDAQN